LTVDPSRPLHARLASDNVTSHRVLEKCGFRVIATERSFAEARSGEIGEFVLRLDEGREDELPAIGAAPRFEYGRAAAALRHFKWNRTRRRW
jgi:RimJ/RimL family protein N-acetyltransferase